MKRCVSISPSDLAPRHVARKRCTCPVSAETLSVGADDEYLITLARSARVEALVSGDDHLLRLGGVIPAVSPHAFLKSLDDRQ